MQSSLLDTESDMAPIAAQTVQAIRVACDGEAQSKQIQTKPLDLYQLQPSDDIFIVGQLSHISKLLGIPLRIRKLRPSLLVPRGRRFRVGVDKENRDPRSMKMANMFGSRADGQYHPNATASMLLVDCSSEKFFETPIEWLNNVGCVIIAREDRQPLHPAHLTAIIGFINSYYHHGLLQNEAQLTQMITPNEFKGYYYYAMEEASKGNGDPDILNTPRPFADDEVNRFPQQADGAMQVDAVIS